MTLEAPKEAIRRLVKELRGRRMIMPPGKSNPADWPYYKASDVDQFLGKVESQLRRIDSKNHPSATLRTVTQGSDAEKPELTATKGGSR